MKFKELAYASIRRARSRLLDLERCQCPGSQHWRRHPAGTDEGCYLYIMECSHLGRITIDPVICHGKPCIRGMRWPVEVIIDMLGSGVSAEEILVEHPELEKEDIQASLNYAKLMVSGHSLGDVA